MLAGRKPKNPGVQNGKLAPCSDRPNCVSSQDSRKSHKIEPLHVEASRQEAMNKVKTVIKSVRGMKIVAEQSGYLHVECKSSLLGFVDDLELLWDEGNKIFHVRSASRLGYSDLGVNRKRVEAMRKRLSVT